MATHQILVATLLVLLLSEGDKVSTEAKEVPMHGRQEEDRCVCTFVSPYFPADSYSRPQPQQARRPDCTDSILDSEFIKQELHFMRRHQIANRKQTLKQGDQLHNLTSRIYQFKDALTANDRVQRSWDMRLLSATADTRELQRVVTRQRDTIGFLRQRVDAMFEEMLQMRELNQRLMFELQDQSDQSEEYRTKLDTLTKRVENIDVNMNEFMFAFAGMKRMVTPGEALPSLAEEPMEEPEVKKDPHAQLGSGDIVFSDDLDYDIVPNPRRKRETDKS
ncbi:Hypp3868 [Branchiostoma lanceolatum]|uniref:Hypp3868 protein n=1 Tax=Branchiostoma lanceolatum TaxID=7740 RepID=A0A8K0A3G7_BRALA|nr:Hypp3868 [Branchiostoma lanceolatum]